MKNFNACMERFGLPSAKMAEGERTPFGSAAAYLAQLEAKFDVMVKPEEVPEKPEAPDA